MERFIESVVGDGASHLHVCWNNVAALALYPCRWAIR